MGRTYGGHYFNSYDGSCIGCGDQRQEVDGKDCPGAETDGGSGLPDCSSDSGHRWGTVRVSVAGFGSLTTFIIEECGFCEILRVRRDVEVYKRDRDGEYVEVTDGE